MNLRIFNNEYAIDYARVFGKPSYMDMAYTYARTYTCTPRALLPLVELALALAVLPLASAAGAHRESRRARPVHVCMYVTYVCMYVCMHACMYVCM